MHKRCKSRAQKQQRKAQRYSGVGEIGLVHSAGWAMNSRSSVVRMNFFLPFRVSVLLARRPELCLRTPHP